MLLVLTNAIKMPIVSILLVHIAANARMANQGMDLYAMVCYIHIISISSTHNSLITDSIIYRYTGLLVQRSNLLLNKDL